MVLVYIITLFERTLARTLQFARIKQSQQLLRAYALKHCYEEARVFERSKSQSLNQATICNCIVIRKGRVKNQSDFGYKQELKTNILKKIYFVYLETTEDLIAFLWKHAQQKENYYGTLMIENIELYFGDHFEYRECGPSFLIVIKLLKLLTTKRGIKGRICFTLVYSEEIFKKASFEELIRSEDITDWEILQGEVLKNGERYESDQTKHFFAQYLRDLQLKPRQDTK